jgi:Zn-dependent protease
VALRIFGFPVELKPSFFLISILLGYGSSTSVPAIAAWTAMVGVAVLIHELGHAFAYRRYGHGARIELYSMGGLTYSTGGPQLRPLQSALVSFAGPAAGFALAALVIGADAALDLRSQSPQHAAMVARMIWVTAGWSVLNLLPLLPLDGGSIFLSILRTRLPNERAVDIASVVSILVAAGGGYYAYTSGMTWSLMLALWFGISNVQTLMHRRREVNEGGHRETLVRAIDALKSGDNAAAAAAAAEVRKAIPSGDLHVQARVVGAVAALRAKDPARAWDEIAPVPGRAVDQDLLQAIEAALFEAKDYARSEAASAKRYELFNSPDGAYNAACAAARAGRADAAADWLGHALDAGYADTDGLAKDGDLASLHGHPRWEKLSARAARLAAEKSQGRR